MFSRRMSCLLPRMRFLVCLALVFGQFALPVGAAQDHTPASLPPLPELSLDAFPDTTREALQAAYDAAARQPADADAVGHLGLVLHAWRELDAAAPAYARAQGLAPRQIDWWYFGGLLATRRALPTEAVRQFEQAHRLAPDNPLVALRLADAHLEAGTLDAASALYEVLATRPDTAPAALYGLARVRHATGDYDGARVAYERAIALYPDFGAAHYALAQLQRRAGDREGARASLQRQSQCLACWPMPQDRWRDRVESLRDDAGVLLQRGTARASSTDAATAAEAIRLHEAAIERNPAMGQAHVNLITLYGQTGNLARAEEHYQAARAMPGFAADAHRAFGWLRLTSEKPGEALDAFRASAAVLPTDASTLHGLGLAYEMLDQPAEAADAYRRAVDANPTAHAVRFNLARTLMRLGRVPDAIAELEHLREPHDADDTPRYVFALAVAYVRAGNIARGRETAEEALALARQAGQADFARAIEAEIAKLPR